MGTTEAGRFRGVDPATGLDLEPWFTCAAPADVAAAAIAADRAFSGYAMAGGDERAVLLETMAAELDQLQSAIIARASQETGLTPVRLEREFLRTTGALRMFAAVVRDESWRRPASDPPTPGAQPGTIPAHDLQRVLVPLGPVAVFGASNFPLAYGVAGGDTASALAAGCPVIVKGHPAHPGTGAMVAEALARAVTRCGMDPGVFAYLHSGGEGEMAVGAGLVSHPLVRAVGFTGSFGGGMALEKAARARREPIPVFAEMGSTNPVFVLPAAARERGEAIGEMLAASVLDSSGQQCTCAGLVFVIEGTAAALMARLRERLEAATSNVMLSRRVRDGYAARVKTCIAVAGVMCTEEVRAFASGEMSANGPVVAPAGMLDTSLEVWRRTETLHEEIFGPALLVVRCATEQEMVEVSSEIPGSLTATVHAADADAARARQVTARAALRAGRVVFNGVPPGVRVADSMVHGGPWPATNRPDTTAVGRLAIERWVRPVCFQNAPEGAIPFVGRAGTPRVAPGER